MHFKIIFVVSAAITNHMLIWCSLNIPYYYQSWKQPCCLIFLWKPCHI